MRAAHDRLVRARMSDEDQWLFAPLSLRRRAGLARLSGVSQAGLSG